MRYDLKECVRGCAKGLLMGLNGICILVALCMIGFAAVDAKILQQYGEGQANGSMIGDIFIILASLLLIIVASYGCIGAAREDVRFLYMYMGFLMILVTMELMLSIFVSLQRYGLEFRVTSWMREDFYRNVTMDEAEKHIHYWQELQSTYECCGLNGPEDYTALGNSISVSCCSRAYHTNTYYAQQQMYKACINSESYYKTGCEEEILYSLREGSDCILCVAVLAICFETFGILLSMWIANNLKNEVKIYKETLKY